MSERKKSLLLFFIVNILIFFTLEFAIRYLEYKKYTSNNSDKFDNQYNNVFFSDLSLPYLYDHKKNINFTLTNKKNDSYTIITNSEGLREKREYSFIDKSIIFLGDSIIEGSSAENYETIDSYFEKLTQIVSLNFGLSGTNTVQQVEYLKHKYKKIYNTKLIILGFCLNDLVTNNYKIYYNSEFQNWMKYDEVLLENNKISKEKKIQFKENKNQNSKLRDIYLYIKNKSKLLIFVANSYNDLKNKKNKILDPYIITNKNLIFTEKPLNELKKYANQIDAKLLILIFPTESQILFNLKTNKIIYPQAQQRLLKVIKKLDIEYYDLFKEFLIEYKTNEQIDLYYDNIHPNPKGYKFISNKLYDKLKNNKILE